MSTPTSTVLGTVVAPSAVPTAHPKRPASARTQSARSIRAVGLALAVTAPLWAVTMAVVGGHEGFGWQSLLGGVTALAFQLTVLALLRVQDAGAAMTASGGTGRVARIGYRIEAALICGAIVSTVLDSFWLIQGSPVWMAFDLCWPLSMLGMLVIGVRVAIAGRWQAPLRWQVLFAQSWLVWGVPLAAAGATLGLALAAVQVVLGYGLLGFMLARRPEAAQTAG